MGNSCCHAESPCGSEEERSGLLKNDSKATTATGETTVVGTCGPEGGDDVRKTADEANIKAEAVQVSPENGETEPSNTQENGPLQKEGTPTATLSPSKGPKLKENSTRAQDKHIKGTPAGSGQAEPLHCTLNVPYEGSAADDREGFAATNAATAEENPAAVQDKTPDGVTQAAEAKNTSHTETNATRENITLDSSHNDNEDAAFKVTIDDTAAEPSGEFSQNNEVLSVPNTQLAAAARQVSSVPVISQEIHSESSCAVTEDPEASSVRKEADPEDIKNHDGSESHPGSEPSGLNDSGEERDSVSEPVTTDPADASESSKSNQDEKPDPKCSTTSSNEIPSSENITQDNGVESTLEVQNKDVDVPKENNEMKEEKKEEEEEEEEGAEKAPTEAVNQADKDAETQEGTGEERRAAGNSSADVDEKPVTEKGEFSEDGLGNSEEDLYRGAEELSASQTNKAGPPPALETTLEDRCSLAPAVDILSYSEREWKGNTAKSALIRKGYKEMSQRFGSLRRVRGDNYCALRATLFQVLSHSTQLPAWLQEEDITTLPKELEAQEGLISQWTFPGECLQGDGTKDVTQQLKGYVELLRKKWQAAVDCCSAAERQQLCERVFQGGEEELGLLEALKLLMLGRAVELHGCMQGGGDVPLFCWLLFARDTSDCPRSFLSNHLSHVGLSAGLEQVEMFLLGYALQCTIQVYRLYKADTEEFVTYYPDDHKDDWPSVCLVTEDDRHYNVPVEEAAELPKELPSS
ncbi:enolase-phosphatase E1-like [Thunnus thynnus]|uniref:enolase-phosphatase E1-like n=1 Tax=Thunnus thynnus TaxID=8237 RepID=UPI003528C8B2